MTQFKDLGLVEPLLRAVTAEGYNEATPIQADAIPHLLQGRDLLGLAQTGTGKTAAFALPMLQRLAAEPRKRPAPRKMRALVLTPTRELAIQIAESFAAYGRHLRFRGSVLFGGVGQRPQVQALAGGLDVLVATPGRLLDLIAQGHCDLGAVEILVLDEADRMLDMGFVRDVKKIVAMVPDKRQTLLFSATLPESVAGLAAGVLTDPVRVEVAPPASTVERVDQRVLFVEKADKRALLAKLVRDDAVSRAIVFARTKHGADRIAEHLYKAGVAADAIHSNKAQNARQRALDGFKAGKLRVLVATDIAARGIDVDDISHVINFDLPNEPESYVHRIGRTARAGKDGVALSFCDAEELPYLKAIEKAIRRPVPVEEQHPFHAASLAQRHAAPTPRRAPSGGGKPAQSGGRPRGGGGGRGGSHGGSRPEQQRRHAAA
jgi:ATP-dependent RNA helicase RhlE